MMQNAQTKRPEVSRVKSLKRLVEQRKKGDPISVVLSIKSHEGDHVIDLAPELHEAALALANAAADGATAKVILLDNQLTTQQAADILKFSRPHLIKLLNDGAIPFTYVGSKRRLNAKDVYAYKEERRRKMTRGMERLTAMDAELLDIEEEILNKNDKGK